MKYTNLGNTGMRISRICLGCMTYGTPDWRPWILDEEQSMPFFRKAIESGINFFDTANVYSLGVSEEVTSVYRQCGLCQGDCSRGSIESGTGSLCYET